MTCLSRCRGKHGKPDVVLGGKGASHRLGKMLSDAKPLDWFSNLDLYKACRAFARLVASSIDRSYPIQDALSHSQRVAMLASAIGKRMNLPLEGVANLYLGGLLHDLGKLFIPADILLKKGVLDESERAIMRLHPVIGAKFLECQSFFKDLAPVILHHHERIDGKGYPRGLAGENIPLGARLIGVAEAFDAMTASDSYRTPISVEDAIRVLLEHSGTQFDGGVVQALLEELKQAGVTER